MVLAGAIAGLAYGETQGAAEYSETWAMNADPLPVVVSIEPRRVLRLVTSWSRSAAPHGIWVIVQSLIAAQWATTSTWRKK